jgi:SAM-dependent methyltransferase
MQDRARIKDAWTAFWQEPLVGCIRGAPDIAQALRAHWSAFAASLAPAAHVLDIGCGAGAAAQAVTAVRRDVRITGIDLARVPAVADAQIELLPDTAMEALPFADGAFDAAISQFGYEYGQTERTAPELARVLAAGAPFSFLVHHGGSSVVAANRARLSAVVALQEQETRTAFLAGNRIALNAEMSWLRREYPRDALVAEFARTLPARVGMGGAERSAIWSAVEVALAPERAILEGLDASCVAPHQLERWLEPLRRPFEVTSVLILRKPNGEPIAWRIAGTRRSDLEPAQRRPPPAC